MIFEWDEEKAVLHVTKHQVTFDEAQSVFDDPLYVEFFDANHSDDENRYLVLGRSDRSRLLTVSYTERGDQYRIISARLATRKERDDYEEGTTP